jgi:hypothetical protein
MWNIHGCLHIDNTLQSSTHLFLECSFSRKVWENSLQILYTRIQWSNTPSKIFNSWKASYRVSLVNKQLFKVTFLAMPKFITWKIWLARNRALFSDEKSTPTSVASKSLGLLAEHFNNRNKRMSPQQQLNQDEAYWFQKIMLFYPFQVPINLREANLSPSRPL